MEKLKLEIKRGLKLLRSMNEDFSENEIHLEKAFKIFFSKLLDFYPWEFSIGFSEEDIKSNFERTPIYYDIKNICKEDWVQWGESNYLLRQIKEVIKNGSIEININDQSEIKNIPFTVILPITLNGKSLAVIVLGSSKKWKRDDWLIQFIELSALHFGAYLIRQNSQSILLHSEKLASLGEMAGGMAHEINTPLGAIMLSAGQLKELIESHKDRNPLEEEILSDILEASQKISRIVRGLKNFSRDSSGGEFIFCNIIETINESLSLCEITLKNKGIHLQANLPNKLVNVNCNPSQLSQVIINLVNNARDAVEGLKEKWINIDLEVEEDFIEIRVTDSGEGISKEIQKKLFQPFFTTKKIGIGTGLGLSISHGIIKQHKGTLTLDSKSKNTSFLIHLPKFPE